MDIHAHVAEITTAPLEGAFVENTESNTVALPTTALVINAEHTSRVGVPLWASPTTADDDDTEQVPTPDELAIIISQATLLMTILKPTWLRRELKPDGTLKIDVVAPDGVTTDTHALTMTNWLSEAVAAMCGFNPAGHHPPLGDSLR